MSLESEPDHQISEEDPWEDPLTKRANMAQKLESLVRRVGANAAKWDRGLNDQMFIPLGTVDQNAENGVALMRSFRSGFLELQAYNLDEDAGVVSDYYNVEAPAQKRWRHRGAENKPIMEREVPAVAETPEGV